jgi:hypothetical protein
LETSAAGAGAGAAGGGWDINGRNIAAVNSSASAATLRSPADVAVGGLRWTSGGGGGGGGGGGDGAPVHYAHTVSGGSRDARDVDRRSAGAAGTSRKPSLQREAQHIREKEQHARDRAANQALAVVATAAKAALRTSARNPPPPPSADTFAFETSAPTAPHRAAGAAPGPTDGSAFGSADESSGGRAASSSHQHQRSRSGRRGSGGGGGGGGFGSSASRSGGGNVHDTRAPGNNFNLKHWVEEPSASRRPHAVNRLAARAAARAAAIPTSSASAGGLVDYFTPRPRRYSGLDSRGGSPESDHYATS